MISGMCFGAVISVTIAINKPIVATVKPVVAWVTRRITAHPKITELIIKPFLSVIADSGVGKAETSTASEDFKSFL